MKKKINAQLIVISGISILLTLLLVSVVYYSLFQTQVMDDLRSYASVLEETMTEDGTRISGDLLSTHGIRVTLIRNDGSVLFDSSIDTVSLENHKDRPEFIQAIASGEGSSIRKSATMDKSTFYYAKCLDDGNVLRVARDADSMIAVFFSVIPMLIGVILFMTVVSMVLAHFLTKKLVEPIEKMADNVDNPEETVAYEELKPFIATIQKQHDDIIKNVGIRQEFTANVSHELKTPLTSISGYAELIENGMASEQDVQRFAGEIHRNSNRLLTLINDVIRLSELDVCEMDETFSCINLYEIADVCISMLQVNAESHDVTLTLEGESCYINSGRQMMEELLYNLCDNAIRYNNKGGSVKVSVWKQEDDIVLTVADTGIGIPKEHQGRVFERFYRVDKSRSKSTGGTGLGLAIVKHIIARQDAELTLESEVGKGTVIRVIFHHCEN